MAAVPMPQGIDGSYSWPAPASGVEPLDYTSLAAMAAAFGALGAIGSQPQTPPPSGAWPATPTTGGGGQILGTDGLSTGATRQKGAATTAQGIAAGPKPIELALELPEDDGEVPAEGSYMPGAIFAKTARFSSHVPLPLAEAEPTSPDTIHTTTTAAAATDASERVPASPPESFAGSWCDIASAAASAVPSPLFGPSVLSAIAEPFPEPLVAAAAAELGGSAMDAFAGGDMSAELAAMLGTEACPTVGSQGHALGLCKPCAFVFKGGCQTGVMCQFCHLCDPDARRRRKKERQQAKRMGQRAFAA